MTARSLPSKRKAAKFASPRACTKYKSAKFASLPACARSDFEASKLSLNLSFVIFDLSRLLFFVIFISLFHFLSISSIGACRFPPPKRKLRLRIGRKLEMEGHGVTFTFSPTICTMDIKTPRQLEALQLYWYECLLNRWLSSVR